eukprot:TRINITY_DN122_c0_g1_i1.p1 TRINITY_DN122_c0_g1~~TRINITY_DN122_c0_g1_i1.p1  ORF type:complete len:1364 (-),score=419.53 TRINITY_DN122_c0_g1_i1:2222-6313(-)
MSTRRSTRSVVPKSEAVAPSSRKRKTKEVEEEDEEKPSKRAARSSSAKSQKEAKPAKPKASKAAKSSAKNSKPATKPASRSRRKQPSDNEEQESANEDMEEDSSPEEEPPKKSKPKKSINEKDDENTRENVKESKEEVREAMKRRQSTDLSKMKTYEFDRDEAYHRAGTIKALLDEFAVQKEVPAVSEKNSAEELKLPRFVGSYLLRPNEELGVTIKYEGKEELTAPIKVAYIKISPKHGSWNDNSVIFHAYKDVEGEEEFFTISANRYFDNDKDDLYNIIETFTKGDRWTRTGVSHGGMTKEIYLVPGTRRVGSEGNQVKFVKELHVRWDWFLTDRCMYQGDDPNPATKGRKHMGTSREIMDILIADQCIGTSRWEVERLLWLGFYKGESNGCPFSYLGRDVMVIIVSRSRITKADLEKEFQLVPLLESIRPSLESPQIQDPPGLSCALRPFQRKALQWMLRRETTDSVKGSEQLHPAWSPIKLPARGKKPAQIVYYHLGSGFFSTNYFTTTPTLPGGLLCEEMGLGKTVEICSLIMAHPRDPKTFKSDFATLKKVLHFDAKETKKSDAPENERGSRSRRATKQKLPDDLANRERSWQPDPVPIGTTIIVTPQSILQQWFDELTKHMPDMKVHYYTGMNSWGEDINELGRSTSFRSKNKLEEPAEDLKLKSSVAKGNTPPKLTRGVSGQLHFDPSMFSDYDIILTTYNVLQKDMAQHTTFRPSPLICVEWWRVVLDEAQMVSKSNTDTAHMAACLWGANRWCVTGTPIGNSLSEVHGLLEFMYHAPFSDSKSWNAALMTPYIDRSPLGLNAMRRFLKQIMWRHRKAHVEDELKLPPCTEKIVELELSKPEDIYYRHLYRKLSYKLGKNENFGPDQVLQLRQACCHPFVGAKNKDNLGKKRVPMKEMLEKMMQNARWEYEVAVREVAQTRCKIGSMYADPAPYLEVVWNDELEINEPVCQNPPDRDETRAIAEFKAAYAVLQSYLEQNPPVNALSVHTLQVSILNTIVNLDIFNAPGHKKLIKQIVESEEELQKVDDLSKFSAMYKRIGFRTDNPADTCLTTLARFESNVKEMLHRLKYLQKSTQDMLDTKKYLTSTATNPDDWMKEIFGDEKKDKSEEEPPKQACPICNETEMESVCVTKCSHLYCSDCLLAALSERETFNCKICGEVLTKDDVATQSDAASKIQIANVGALSDYGTKVATLVQYLLEFQAKNAEMKSIVFSQWNEVLTLVEDALRKNGILFTRLNGTEAERTKAIQGFQTDPKITVFLISMKWNAGLTLTCAQNCFLLEPSLNPALEEQATNRIYRIGQLKATYVYRFIIKNTIEERILKMQQRKKELQQTHKLAEKEDILKHEDLLEIFE